MSAKFETGKQYQVRSIGDHNCIWTFEVVRRTAKSIWVTGSEHTNKRLVISVRDGVEVVKPFGTYSMSPTLRANNVVKTGEIEITDRAQKEAAACEAEYLADRRAESFFAKALI